MLRNNYLYAKFQINILKTEKFLNFKNSDYLDLKLKYTIFMLNSISISLKTKKLFNFRTLTTLTLKKERKKGENTAK